MPEEPILPIDHPLLAQPSTDVTVFDDDLRRTAEEMFSVMDRESGAGLASVQIGRPLRLVVMDVPDASGSRHRLAMANPRITKTSEETTSELEGCLSMPGYDIPVARHACVTAAFEDLDGHSQTVTASGVFAICIQHEVDHTNGVLFYDRVSRLRRQRAKSYFKKVRREAGRPA
ncbi:MAG: peptide deformylase [Pseudomonadota bacterium]